jgi:hypothetical protein
MGGSLAAIVVLGAAVAERRTGARKAKVASAAASLGNAHTAHSSINDGESGKERKEDSPHGEGLCIRNYE